jgi:hypothetical protein
MPWQPYPSLPRESVRDLLGIVRALYRATDRRDAVRVQALTEIGRDLREALAGSRGTHPGTLRHIEAWVSAERATRRLGELIDSDESQPLAPLVRAVAGRIRQEP